MMKISVDELQHIINELPDAQSHFLNEVHAQAVYFDGKGEINPERRLLLVFSKNEDETGWLLQLDTHRNVPI